MPTVLRHRVSIKRTSTIKTSGMLAANSNASKLQEAMRREKPEKQRAWLTQQTKLVL